jgi:hypothetical protein
MASLASISTATTWPATPAQKFFETYRLAVEGQDFNTPGLGTLYYSPTVIFHNTNGTIYHGAEQMWTWMRDLFAPFERMHHPFEHCVEIANGDGCVPFSPPAGPPFQISCNLQLSL